MPCVGAFFRDKLNLIRGARSLVANVWSAIWNIFVTDARYY